jgi:hypothetical protein
VRRIVRTILRTIPRGQLEAAICLVSRRFGLRHTRARACITACLDGEVQFGPDVIAMVAIGPSSLASALADRM